MVGNEMQFENEITFHTGFGHSQFINEWHLQQMNCGTANVLLISVEMKMDRRFIR